MRHNRRQPRHGHVESKELTRWRFEAELSHWWRYWWWAEPCGCSPPARGTRWRRSWRASCCGSTGGARAIAGACGSFPPRPEHEPVPGPSRDDHSARAPGAGSSTGPDHRPRPSSAVEPDPGVEEPASHLRVLSAPATGPPETGASPGPAAAPLTHGSAAGESAVGAWLSAHTRGSWPAWGAGLRSILPPEASCS